MNFFNVVHAVLRKKAHLGPPLIFRTNQLFRHLSYVLSVILSREYILRTVPNLFELLFHFHCSEQFVQKCYEINVSRNMRKLDFQHLISSLKICVAALWKFASGDTYALHATVSCQNVQSLVSILILNLDCHIQNSKRFIITFEKALNSFF